ncbi:SdpI family protein [Staphylococcus sp. IVB6238]|uniref:SdpI family protein n=1 Tax=unclassified Staphylococcus TaxID=91994 RepID=UPI0021CE3B9C|nr:MULTISPECIES: SdpI family protein [unclassified Staphylococcus]UXR71742.1 SdpI family protein [Staphylococcus sp. IVB6240]UXR74046.1 SdpI family protein [Staphylococcus sp. IVB6238]
MILLISSFISLMITRLFVGAPPIHMNYFSGFRSKKAMKSQKNWERAQKLYTELFVKACHYTWVVSVVPLIIDIALLIMNNDKLFITSIISQVIIFFLVHFVVYWKVNRQLD